MTPAPEVSGRTRLALTLVTGLLAAMLVYALLRLLQALVMTEPDPVTVLWSEHSGFFWRAWTSAYAGGAAAFAGWVIATRAPLVLARVLAAAVFPVTAALAAQALFVP